MKGPPKAIKGEASAHQSAIERLLGRNRRVGCCRIRIHKDKYYEIEPHPRQIPRRRWYRKSPTAAYEKALEVTKEVREHGNLSRALSSGQRWVATECFRLITPITGDDPAELLYIVRDWMKRHPMAGNSRTLDAVRKELIAHKEKIKRSERHVAGLDYKLRCLIQAIGNQVITDVTTEQLEAELEEHPDWKPSTFHSTVQGWKILFNFAKKRRYIIENPADRLELPRIVHEEPRVLTIDEVKRLLAATLFEDLDPILPYCQPYLTIGMFAGLRPQQEMPQLKWGDINLDAGTITVRAASAKLRVRRIVTMEPNLVAWLRPIARNRGPVLQRPVDQLRIAARRVLGLPAWPADVLRHTFASYYFELYHDEARTKKQLGHRDDGRVFYDHYCRPVYPKDAAEFWRIVPPVGFLTA